MKDNFDWRKSMELLRTPIKEDKRGKNKSIFGYKRRAKLSPFKENQVEAATRAEELYDNGMVFFNQGEFEKAEQYRQKAIEISSVAGWDENDFPPYEEEVANRDVKKPGYGGNSINEKNTLNLTKYMKKNPLLKAVSPKRKFPMEEGSVWKSAEYEEIDDALYKIEQNLIGFDEEAVIDIQNCLDVIQKYNTEFGTEER